MAEMDIVMYPKLFSQGLTLHNNLDPGAKQHQPPLTLEKKSKSKWSLILLTGKRVEWPPEQAQRTQRTTQEQQQQQMTVTSVTSSQKVIHNPGATVTIKMTNNSSQKQQNQQNQQQNVQQQNIQQQQNQVN